MLWPARCDPSSHALRGALQDYVASAKDVRRAALDSVDRSVAPGLPERYPEDQVAHACIVAAQQAVSVARGQKR